MNIAELEKKIRQQENEIDYLLDIKEEADILIEITNDHYERLEAAIKAYELWEKEIKNDK